jgi:hypothetical protein
VYEGTDPIKDGLAVYHSNMLTKIYKEQKSQNDSSGTVILNEFGHGIKAYFGLINTLMKTMLALWFLSLPITIIYHYNQYQYE